MNQVVNKNQDDQNYELLSELVSLRRTARLYVGDVFFVFPLRSLSVMARAKSV